MRAIFLIIVAILFFGEKLPPHQRCIFGIQHDISCKIQDFLQRTGRNVQYQTHPAGNPLEIPDMGDRRRQINVAHPVPADFGFSDFNAATVAYYAFVTNPFVFAAMTFPVTGWPEDFLAKQAVTFWFQCAIIYRFRLFYFTVGPARNLFGRGQANPHRIEIIHILQDSIAPLLLIRSHHRLNPSRPNPAHPNPVHRLPQANP